MLESVPNFVRLFLPCLKRGQRLSVHHPDHRNSALGWGLLEFMVDHGIVKADLGRVRSHVAVIDTGNMRPVDSAQAHGARFTRRIELAIFELEDPKPPASFADSHN